MRAVEIAGHGGPDVLRAIERRVPAPADGEVLVRVAGAGGNRPGGLQRVGEYPPPPGASDIPGLEGAGAIVGPRRASSFQIGQRVCALVTGGGYAEYCVAPAEQCLRAPEGLPLHHAAAIPETFFTVWTNLFDRGRLQRGERVLIHGGTSGIGTTAIQLARAFRAPAIATAGAHEEWNPRERLGAQRAVNHHTQDLVHPLGEVYSG